MTDDTTGKAMTQYQEDDIVASLPFMNKPTEEKIEKIIQSSIALRALLREALERWATLDQKYEAARDAKRRMEIRRAVFGEEKK
jgi:hypothetical protein